MKDALIGKEEMSDKRYTCYIYIYQRYVILKKVFLKIENI